MSSSGREAVELARMAGLDLDPWQQVVLEEALGERRDGKWAAFEVGLVVSRQNGKGAVLEARELAGLFLLGERLIIHSAHQFDTSLEAFRRLLALIEATPDLDRRVRRVVRSHGEEGIELLGGQRIRFRTRTKGGGRGFSSDCLILDEAMILPEVAHGALLPTLSARPNPQVWYTGSAVDQIVHEDGVVLARIRERGHRGGDPSLAFFEWSAPLESPGHVADGTDVELWAAANPGLGIRITAEHVGREFRSMDPRTFAVERLGVGDWPATDGDADTVISVPAWNELIDKTSVASDPVVFAFDVNPERAWASIAAASRRPDGLVHLELADRRPGVGWLADRVVELREKHSPAAVVCDLAGPAASILHELEERNVTVEALNSHDQANACGAFFDAVGNGGVRHLGSPEIVAAIKGAAKRPLGDAWAWSRKNSGVDISPLVAFTLAAYGLATVKGRKEPAFVWG